MGRASSGVLAANSAEDARPIGPHDGIGSLRNAEAYFPTENLTSGLGLSF